MVSSADFPANFSSSPASVYPTSPLTVMVLFYGSFPCPAQCNLLQTVRTLTLPLAIVCRHF
jgi:hypothetical protein